MREHTFGHDTAHRNRFQQGADEALSCEVSEGKVREADSDVQRDGCPINGPWRTFFRYLPVSVMGIDPHLSFTV
jgi:hypothetical protein